VSPSLTSGSNIDDNTNNARIYSHTIILARQNKKKDTHKIPWKLNTTHKKKSDKINKKVQFDNLFLLYKTKFVRNHSVLNFIAGK
jgi:hypothetical protein